MLANSKYDYKKNLNYSYIMQIYTKLNICRSTDVKAE